ncbi:double-strand break repair helicase AddA [Sphingomonas sp. CCH15-F11]|uniref:double-strand break repair helicase AddA n=1 Tax=Sphingomonas sp. CCH15-F11 TaxID=1768785 RepID=UPI00082E7C3C|nr:double-strand break repair helicase AddA [Sphingomonas sp. CCH15-F11]
MSKAGSLLPRLKGDQARASDPEGHVWLSASAGTGKTQVLTARVYRLLLRGVDPAAVLCLTFTKAGASEMAGRINGRLARWVRMPEPDLRKELFALGENHLDPAVVARARTLFARVLDAPGGGIRIQTIHSFCQSLLAAFPLEAGLLPGFRPLEGREEQVLAREALAELLVAQESLHGSDVLDAVRALSLRMGEGRAEAFLRACAARPDAMARLPGLIQPFVRDCLDLPPGDVEAAIAAACADDACDIAGLRAVAAMNAGWGTKNGLARADAIAHWLSRDPGGRAAGLGELHLVWAKADGDLRSFAKGQAPLVADYADLATRFHGWCGELVGLRARAGFADLLAQGLTAGRAYAETYAASKRRIGAVDFNDLIRETARLLALPGIGDWVRYKLDQVTEHILIDEAQDTNWPQWEIVRRIADEFFAGEGAKGDRLRTLFTVGDYKQAIFGFQGTDPYNFALAHRMFEQLAGPDQPFTTLSLTDSFRSTEPILTFVDAAIAALPDDALGAHSTVEPHGSNVPGPGRVTLWAPVIEGGSDEDAEGWADDAARGMATRIATEVAAWIDQGRITPGEVMILVKRRGELAALIVARLYAAGVPVAGVDRLRLNAPLAVQDLLAAIRFALQPDDDLSLASLLVSPLIGWSQDELMAAAVRERGSLWRHLRATQPDDRLAPLYAMLAQADFTTPYRFLEDLLSGALDGRRKLIRRLGAEARDPIEELLTAALGFERLATPSLQRFIDWFDRGDVDIKRDPSQAASAVRVMTAHGAKGLQAPLVILADATVDPTRNRRDLLDWPVFGDREPALPLIRPRRDERSAALEALLDASDAREMEEHWRLFYVAATRAERWLVIGGALGPRANGSPPEQSWYAAAARAFDRLGVAEADAGGDRDFTGVGVTHAGGGAARAERPPQHDAVDLPDWLRAPAPAEARPPRPLAPSAIGDDAIADPPLPPKARAAAVRGQLLHRLFERLPAVAPAERRDAALRWLMQAAGVTDMALATALVDDALRVIDDPRFAGLFGIDALAEAPIAAVVDGLVISGTVDRLRVEEDRVQVVDFKTGRIAPATLADVPEYHLRQMASYAAALAVIFPGRTIEASLLYTSGPVLHTLPAALLARHKPGYDPAQLRLSGDA